MSMWIRSFKWIVTALVAAPPLLVLFGPVLRADVEIGGVWMVFVGFLLLPALIYGAGMRTQWGIIRVGTILLLVTARTWWTLEGSDPANPFNGLIPFVGLIPAALVALLGAVADLGFRFFREPRGAGSDGDRRH